MNDTEIIHLIALTQVEGVGLARARALINAMGSATNVFAHHAEAADILPGLKTLFTNDLTKDELIARAEKEYEFIKQNNIRGITIHDEDYPSRLRECDDAPLVLFYKGTANMNAFKVINMVGTRHATDYGKELCMRFLTDLKALCPEVLVVSGLAYGIDVHAHRAALHNNLPTIGVLAHGLDRIYPNEHRNVAAEMVQHGGVLTEFPSGTNPDRHNFVKRNRIVAGMCDATIVVESAAKGGSLITADLALGYNRECFAFPGRTNDTYSEGCNKLIRDNKAGLIQSAEDFVRAMSWNPASRPAKPKYVQRSLFPELSDDEQKVVDALTQQSDTHINALVLATDIPIQKMSALLFELEMKGVVRAMVGNAYQLI